MTLPTGTVTFLRSDIVGSMAHVRDLGARYDELNAEHAELVRSAIVEHGGEVVRTEGDAFFAVFTEAGAAARAAVGIQRTMAGHDWPEGHALRVRIGLHTGSAVRAGDDYGGIEVSRAARVADVGNGGQIVATETARALILADPPEGGELLDLGRHRLKGIPEPEQLYQLVAPGLDRDFEPLRSTHGPREYLPERLAPLIGREADLVTLDGLLEDTRLLTLTGPGGTGKTTLALEFARRHAHEYRDGARLVDLQTVTDAGRVRGVVARGIGLFDGPNGSAENRLLPFVGERELLIVIDNFEQVLDAGDIVPELLGASPSSRIIATSRIPLRLAAEQEYAVRPLRLATEDEPTSEAARLFLDRARKSRHDLTPDDSEMDAIEEVCKLVDGLPLAIELCAARVGVLPVERIRDRLSQQLPLPGSGPRHLPARHRTIDETVEWSLDLLDAPLRRLFVRLGVFSGSFELEQVEAVCADEGGSLDLLDGIARLVEHSLLTRVDDRVGGVRFRMLEMIRAAARGRLEASSEADELHARHAQAYLRLAERLLPKHHEPVVVTWLDRLEADVDNLRQATNWAIDAGDVDLALELTGYPWKFWVHSGRIAEGRRLNDRALALPHDGAPSEARVWAISAAGSLAYWSNDFATTPAFYEEQLELAAGSGYALCEANAWFNLIFVRRASGDMSGADEAAMHAQRILSELGETELLQDIEAALAVTAAPAVMTDPEHLLPILAEQLEQLEKATSPAAQAALPAIRAQYYFASGETDRAIEAILEALRSGLAWGMLGDVITSLAFLAALGVHRLPPEVPATLLAVVESASQRYGVTGPRWADLLPDFLPADPLAAVEAEMTPEAFEQATERGKRLSLAEAVDYFESHASDFGPLRPT